LWFFIHPISLSPVFRNVKIISDAPL